MKTGFWIEHNPKDDLQPFVVGRGNQIYFFAETKERAEEYIKNKEYIYA